MAEKYFDEENPVYVTRVILGASTDRERPAVVKFSIVKNGPIADYKAASNRRGTTKNFSTSRQKFLVHTEEKSAARSVARSAISVLVPGDISPVRSPARSAIYRTLTPGKITPSISSPGPGNRAHRCPEGYQYGGRFTDSRLSTCGMKLFDIPSPLGAALAEIRRAVRAGGVERITTSPLGGMPPPGDPTTRRDPNIQIPKVSTFNKAAFLERIQEMIKGLSTAPGGTSRMVRRDGYVLQPVVPARVLRSVPDNRDMEGASYLSTVRKPNGFDKDQVGLLSNTGVKSVIYVLPGGSTISLEKARDLTVGERRKLGRTIRTAEEKSTPSDPTGNMKYIAEQMGDGVLYKESFEGIKNPNEIVNGKLRWVRDVFSKSNLAKNTFRESSRDSASNASIGKKIKSIETAIEHIANGGSLSDIAPETLAKLLSRRDVVQSQRINNRQSMVVVNGKKYILYSPKSEYAHLAERFSSDVQQHLGLESPDVLMVGKSSNRRKYLSESVETALPGAVFNPNGKMSDFKPEDVAKMMISDFLTDQRERELSSVYALTTIDGEVPMFGQNQTSGLVDLSKIEITKRMKASIAEFYSSQNQIDYSEYYRNLKAEQQLAYRRFIEQLINRARDFKVAELARRLKSDGDGLTAGEEAHLKIIEKIYSSRLAVLAASKKSIMEYLRG